tara:strand:- start:28473 stop:29147 length:675 start_codon:yes stop_codon:yes gene_type:complete
MKINTVKAWSYSALALFESCPRQFKYRKIDKLPEPKAPAMARGIAIHNEAAKFLEGKTDVIPESCKLFEDQFRELRDMNPIVEQQWSFTKGYKSVSWFDKKTHLRIILDAGAEYSDNTAECIDHKTGKYREGDHDVYDEQMDLFAAGMMLRNRLLTSVTTRLWFLDAGEEVIREVSRAQAMLKLDELEDRADIMLNTERFPPNPSWKCRFCVWSADDGGQCEFK